MVEIGEGILENVENDTNQVAVTHSKEWKTIGTILSKPLSKGTSVTICRNS